MRGDWKTIAVRRRLRQDIDQMLLTESAKDTGLVNATQFVENSIREMLRGVSLRRFELVGVHDDHVSMMDTKVTPLGTTASIYLRKEKPWCDSCDKHACIHIQYMWEISDVREALMDRGFRPPDAYDSS